MLVGPEFMVAVTDGGRDLQFHEKDEWTRRADVVCVTMTDLDAVHKIIWVTRGREGRYFIDHLGYLRVRLVQGTMSFVINTLTCVKSPFL
jgi:hypothetical protein